MDGREFPFYYVQIAPFDYGEKHNRKNCAKRKLKALSLQTLVGCYNGIGSPITCPGNKKR